MIGAVSITQTNQYIHIYIYIHIYKIRGDCLYDHDRGCFHNTNNSIEKHSQIKGNTSRILRKRRRCFSLEICFVDKPSCIHTATHCNALQCTATHCNALQRTATHCNTLQHTATLCNALQHTATHCNTLQHTAPHCNALQHTATHELCFVDKHQKKNLSRIETYRR